MFFQAEQPVDQAIELAPMNLSFRRYLRKYAAFSDEELDRVGSQFSHEVLDKGTLLLQAGMTCEYLYYLGAGILRYYQSDDWEEQTKFFTFEDQLFTSPLSFSNQVPALESIEVLEAGWILKCPYAAVQALYSEVPNWATFIRKVLLEVQTTTARLLVESQSQTATERYAQLLTEQPRFIQKIPLKYLASYLGIAPESLSRIRKKLS